MHDSVSNHEGVDECISVRCSRLQCRRGAEGRSILTFAYASAICMRLLVGPCMQQA